MDSQPNLLISSSRIGLRPWHRRSDRRQIDRWPPYSPTLPLHWTAAPPADGACSSYAVDLLAMPPADRLIGRISFRQQDRTARIGIVLHPDRLGIGLGTEAMLLAVRLADGLGLASLRLDVAVTNRRAVRCYERAGFVVTGETWRGGYHYLDMERACIPLNC